MSSLRLFCDTGLGYVYCIIARQCLFAHKLLELHVQTYTMWQEVNLTTSVATAHIELHTDATLTEQNYPLYIVVWTLVIYLSSIASTLSNERYSRSLFTIQCALSEQRDALVNERDFTRCVDTLLGALRLCQCIGCLVATFHSYRSDCRDTFTKLSNAVIDTFLSRIDTEFKKSRPGSHLDFARAPQHQCQRARHD